MVWRGSWAQISLTGIALDADGDERVSRVGFSISLFPPPAAAEPGWWEFDLADVEARLSNAKEWLLDNERGRLSLEDETGLTAAGRAMDNATDPLEP